MRAGALKPVPLRPGDGGLRYAPAGHGPKIVRGEKTLTVITPSVRTDPEGYLVDPSDWTEDIARALAEREGIALTDEHWDVIRFMRAYWEEHRIAPDARFVVRHLKETRQASRDRLFELFPYGYVQQACKIAGMMRPRSWSTG
jgi:tRNA 2-thiouridine synthesizing protein E